MSSYGTSGGNGGYGYSGYAWNEQDRDRRFLSQNGGCAYIELSHLELVELARRERANAGNPLGWDAPELKHLDLLYSSLDPAKGLYWAYQAAGAFHSVVDEAEIVRFTREPPDDTRAWTRAMLLRQFGSSGEIERVDWDRVELDAPGDDGRLRHVELALDDPCDHTRADNAHLFSRGVAAAASATGGDTPSPRSSI